MQHDNGYDFIPQCVPQQQMNKDQVIQQKTSQISGVLQLGRVIIPKTTLCIIRSNHTT